MKERIAAQVFREGDKQNYLDHTFLLLSHFIGRNLNTARQTALRKKFFFRNLNNY